MYPIIYIFIEYVKVQHNSTVRVDSDQSRFEHYTLNYRYF